MLFPRRTYVVLICALLLLFASTLVHRVSHFDDAWCTEQSYWLLKDGVVRSELFRGYNRWHEQLYVFHKAFVYLQAGILYFTGPTVWGARATPLLFTAVGWLLLLFYFRRNLEGQLLATLLYVGCGTLWLFGVDNRPETMVAAFGFTSFLLLQQTNRSFLLLVLAGVAAGIAALAHLNGLVYIAAGAGWLLLAQRNWRAALVFGVAGGCTAGLYLLDALLNGQLELLLYQFTHDHVTQNNQHWDTKLRLMAQYHRLFFHSEGEGPLTALVIVVALVLSWRRSGRVLLTPTAQYTLLLVGTFWVLTKSNTAYYFLLFVPFFVVLVAEWVLTIPLTAARRAVLFSLLLCYPLGSALRGYYLLKENAMHPNTLAKNAHLARYMPQRGAKVIAPIDFFFGQMPNYRVRGLTYYALLNANEYQGQLALNDFFALAEQDTVRYIVSDLRVRNQVYHIPADAPSHIGSYHKIFQNQWHSVFERRP